MTVQDGDDLQRLGVRPVDDQLGVHREELDRLIRQVLAPVSTTGGVREECDLITNGRFDFTGGLNAGPDFDVSPDLSKMSRGLRRENVAPPHSG
jgi:hypothetical protein